MTIELPQKVMVTGLDTFYVLPGKTVTVAGKNGVWYYGLAVSTDMGALVLLPGARLDQLTDEVPVPRCEVE